jgi:hypothetical protein
MSGILSLKDIFNFSSEELDEKLFIYDSEKLELWDNNITNKRIILLKICYNFSFLEIEDMSLFNSDESIYKFIKIINSCKDGNLENIIEKYNRQDEIDRQNEEFRKLEEEQIKINEEEELEKAFKLSLSYIKPRELTQKEKERKMRLLAMEK